MVLHVDILCHVAFAMLPRVAYTGHAALSPLNCESCVLSDAKIIGAMVAKEGDQVYP